MVWAEPTVLLIDFRFKINGLKSVVTKLAEATPLGSKTCVHRQASKERMSAVLKETTLN
jgi:hypothetical protein